MSKDVIDTDLFLDMPTSTQNLYYYFLLKGDDDGFISAPKKIMRMIGANEDDLKILLAKKFLIKFESGVVVIRHWKIHNYIRKDRYVETTNKEEKAQLSEKEGVYNQRSTTGQPMVTTGKDRLGKDSIDKDCSNEQVVELEYEPVEDKIPKQSPARKFLNEKRKKAGKPPMKIKRSTAQEKTMFALQIMDYFRDTAYGEHRMTFFAHDEDRKQIKNKNARLRGQVDKFFKRCDFNTEKAKKVVDFYLDEYGAWCNYKPEQCFKVDTVTAYENKDVEVKSNKYKPEVL